MKLKRNLSLLGVSLFVVPVGLQTTNNVYTKILNKNNDLKILKNANDEIDEESKVVYDTFSDEKQKEYFKTSEDLKFDDLYSESEYDYDDQQIKKNSNYTNLIKFNTNNNYEISKKQAIKENYEKIISGELKVYDILKDVKNTLLSHKKEFISFKKEFDKNLKLYELKHTSESENTYNKNKLNYTQENKSLSTWSS
ncbi:hypothetical protein NX779_02955 [Mycoplasma cottewii]|uniref:Uncharacterized protein n=1 Tax=Mycoplasma cottewii TaxID=51364 RepID=A0ABY5U0D1_9MOLU|nr:hypothetical protein [Mycoplasma cottewii]UWD34749.1 hypothetical protein NX779_02955 [Mycoplasma cottewii]